MRCFEAAARHLSFTLAAEELNMTQSAVSKQVAMLEYTLKIQLF
ncbi:MAG TPA: LysR family transcriptional regulator, partial [Vitreoscilla sp.]|nr:LysR family transcriptional regulator [Vitreoscilla sp.]